MRRSLHDLVIPILRQRGYRGTWPVMSRQSDDGTQFVVFELAGRGEAVRIGLAGADNGVGDQPARLHVLPPDVDVTYLRPAAAGGDDAWFGLAEGGADRVAAAVLDALIQQGGSWWAKTSPRVSR